MNERGRGGKGMRERRGGWPGRERQRGGHREAERNKEMGAESVSGRIRDSERKRQVYRDKDM